MADSSYLPRLCTLPQRGHLILVPLNLGGTLSLVPQSQVMVLYLLIRQSRSSVSRVRSILSGSSAAAARSETAPEAARRVGADITLPPPL